MPKPRIVGLAVVGAIAVVLALRFGLAADRSEQKVAAAHALIARALEGETRAWDEAERSLASAAGLTDPYPLFVLEAARRLREQRWADAPLEVRAVLEALHARRFDAAVLAADAVPSSLHGGAELARLARALRAASTAPR